MAFNNGRRPAPQQRGANPMMQQGPDYSMKTPEQLEIIQRYFDYVAQGGGCGAKTTPEMTKQEYLQKVAAKEETYNYYKMAINKLGIDPDQVNEVEPLELVSFNYYGLTDDDPLPRYKNGTTNLYQTTLILFGDEEFYIYTFTFDMISDSFKETTKEYFYKDVVSAGTTLVAQEVVSTTVGKGSGCAGKLNVNHSKALKKNSTFFVNASGDSFHCNIANTKDVLAGIKGMLAKLREKKAN